MLVVDDSTDHLTTGCRLCTGCVCGVEGGYNGRNVGFVAVSSTDVSGKLSGWIRTVGYAHVRGKI